MVCSSWGEPLHSQLTPATFPVSSQYSTLCQGLWYSWLNRANVLLHPALENEQRAHVHRQSPMPRSHSAYRSTSSAFFQTYERIDSPTTVSAAPRSNHLVFFSPRLTPRTSPSREMAYREQLHCISNAFNTLRGHRHVWWRHRWRQYAIGVFISVSNLSSWPHFHILCSR